MVREIEYMPIVSFRSALRGFIAGSLIVSGAANPWGSLAQLVLVVVGFLILLDSLIPHGRQPYIVTSVVLTFIGGIVSYLATLAGQGLAYLVLVIILAVIVYLHRLGVWLRGGALKPEEMVS